MPELVEIEGGDAFFYQNGNLVTVDYDYKLFNVLAKSANEGNSIPRASGALYVAFQKHFLSEAIYCLEKKDLTGSVTRFTNSNGFSEFMLDRQIESSILGKKTTVIKWTNPPLVEALWSRCIIDSTMRSIIQDYGGYLAGGAVMRATSPLNFNTPSDVDIFFLNGGNPEHCGDALNKYASAKSESNHGLYFRLQYNYVRDTPSIINLITADKYIYPSIADNISRFDFRCCSIAIDHDSLYFVEDALGDICHKLLITNNEGHGLCISRLLRYKEKGFRVPIQTIHDTAAFIQGDKYDLSKEWIEAKS